jgi:hypothetical protein
MPKHVLQPSGLEEWGKHFSKGKSIGWILMVAAVVWILWLIFNPPALSVAIASAAVPAAIMSFRESLWERVVWLVVIVALIGFEVRAIRASDEQARTDKNQLADRFNGIAQSLSASIKANKKGFDDALAKSQEINRLAAEGLKQATSEGSFCFVEFIGNDNRFNRRRLMISTMGNYPLYDVGVTFNDPELNRVSTVENPQPNALFSQVLGTLPANEGFQWEYVALPENSKHKWFSVWISSRNQYWVESIDLIKINGVWQQGLQVTIPPSIRFKSGKIIFELAPASVVDDENVKWVFKKGRWTQTH